MIICNNYGCKYQSKRRTTITNVYGRKKKVHTCKLKTITLSTDNEMRDYFGSNCTQCVNYEQIPMIKEVE